MGFFSDLKKLGEAVGGLNQAAGEVSRTTLEDYGEPEYSLFTALQLGELHRRIDITDAKGSLRYYTKSSVFALKGKNSIGIYQPDQEEAAVAIVIQLEKMIETRSENRN